MNMYPVENPMVGDDANFVLFRQTQETTIDADEYSHFIYNIESQFRKLRFYKDYKASLYNYGLDYDQQMKGINSNMASIEMHHHLPTLKEAAIIISEKNIRTKGYVNSFDVIAELVEAHRRNIMGVIMMSITNHQLYHDNPNAFIPIGQLFGYPLIFLQEYYPYFTMDIAYRWLLQFKMNEQYSGQVNWPNFAVARQQLMNYSGTPIGPGGIY